MSHNYKLVEGENRSLYYVKETKTDQIIKTFKVFSEGRAFMRHLNLGGGFDGWTPEFFLKNIVKKSEPALNKSSKNM